MRTVILRAVALAAAAAAVAVPAAAAAAAGAPMLAWAPATAGSFSYGTLAAGQAVATTFTLANSGGAATSALKITLAGASAFTKTADTCTGTSLGPKKACKVTVTYTAPATPGSYQATLTAASLKPAATASVTLTGATDKATPAITTAQQPASATAGTSVADQATVSGGDNPTGAVTFKLYNNPNCSGTALFTDTEALSAGAATSAGYTATATGTDYWAAAYNGDSNNHPVASGCSGEPVVTTPATPAINVSQQPASATVGTEIADQATVSGGFNPTGTVTFALYDNPNCTGTPLFTDTENLTGGAATSAGYTAGATGTDYWQAAYNGDGNNNPVSSGCGSAPVTITLPTPAIGTAQQPKATAVGSTVADRATVSGGDNPTGTVTFTLYDNPNCSGTPLFTDTENLTGGAATSAGYAATAAGTDYWQAAYNGDGNNNPVSSGCAGEPVFIDPAATHLATNSVQVSPGVYQDQATLSNTYHATGGIRFQLFASPAVSCASTPVLDQTVPVSGDGTYDSPDFTATTPGNYWWVVTYPGDANNFPAFATCGGEGFVVS